jgi:hypothetical protein
MDLSEIQTLVGALTNDTSHDRYTTDQINTELNNTQDKWNVRARILKDTVTITVVDGTRQYAISGLTGTVVAFGRVTHKGLELEKKDKAWFDLYAGDDWTDDVGTPRKFLIDATDPDVQYITLYPIPQSEDAGDYLVVEYVKRHTTLSSSSDEPFNGNDLLLPYHYGLAYDVAARLLTRDPSPENKLKSDGYRVEGADVLTDVVQTFKALEKEEPYRLRGGRVWR